MAALGPWAQSEDEIFSELVGALALEYSGSTFDEMMQHARILAKGILRYRNAKFQERNQSGTPQSKG